MNIEITDYHDINIENIDQAKVDLADKIIYKVKPLIDDLHLDKERQIRLLENNINKKKNFLLESKKKLEQKVIVLERKKKIKKLVERIEQLNSFGMLYGDLKKEMSDILNNLNSIDDTRMNKYLQTTMEIVNKRILK